MRRGPSERFAAGRRTGRAPGPGRFRPAGRAGLAGPGTRRRGGSLSDTSVTCQGSWGAVWTLPRALPRAGSRCRATGRTRGPVRGGGEDLGWGNHRGARGGSGGSGNALDLAVGAEEGRIAAGDHAEFAGAALEGVGGRVGVHVPLEGLFLVGQALGLLLEVVEAERAFAERRVQHEEPDEAAAEEKDDQEDEGGAGRLPGPGREEPREPGGPSPEFGSAAHAPSLWLWCAAFTAAPWVRFPYSRTHRASGSRARGTGAGPDARSPPSGGSGNRAHGVARARVSASRPLLLPAPHSADSSRMRSAPRSRAGAARRFSATSSSVGSSAPRVRSLSRGW